MHINNVFIKTIQSKSDASGLECLVEVCGATYSMAPRKCEHFQIILVQIYILYTKILAIFKIFVVIFFLE